MSLQAGDTLTVQQLLEGLLVPSGSDGANALARHVGGLIDPAADDPTAAFVSTMNIKAADLGMTNTVFANPHGNDAEGAHSSARDLAVAAKALLADPVLAEIVAMPRYSFTSVGPEAREYTAESTNQLLTDGDPGILGVKSGSTDEAGGCLVLAFDPGEGQVIILVILGSDLEYEGDWITLDARWDEARSLIAWLRESSP
jgi:D-alanyl-D-alanine carboxypeptidase (penicillin-binding protein 5/6)